MCLSSLKSRVSVNANRVGFFNISHPRIIICIFNHNFFRSASLNSGLPSESFEVLSAQAPLFSRAVKRQGVLGIKRFFFGFVFNTVEGKYKSKAYGIKNT